MPKGAFYRCTDFGCRSTHFDTWTELKAHQASSGHSGFKLVNTLPGTSVIQPAPTRCPSCGKLHPPGTQCKEPS